jgi:hypothetical protein
MPGVRDRNLRSGDLHEELGLFLLRMVALVAPVPRQEDIGNDAFVTLVRPDGSRRLLPDVSCLVQLKAASIGEVNYPRPDDVAWIKNLEIPLFIGRVDLRKSRIELFTTYRLHQILIERDYEEICLLLDPNDETSKLSAARRAYIGPPIHAWSIEDGTQPDFLMRSHEILRPHVESLRHNRHLREMCYLRMLKWETGIPPVDNGIMMTAHSKGDTQNALQNMVPSIHQLLNEVWYKKRYGDFPTLVAMVQLMRRWGVDPDPNGTMLQTTACQAEGPEISDEDVIRVRHWAGFNFLALNNLKLSEESLVAIPVDVENLAMCNFSITDAGVKYLLRLTKLSRLNLAGTGITDSGLDQLATLRSLRWLNVEQTQVTKAGISRLKVILPNLDIIG